VGVKDAPTVIAKRISHIWLYLLPIFVGAAVGITLGAPHGAEVSAASTNAGPSQWTKYAFNAANNPVDESPSVAGWSVDWTYNAPEPLQQASEANGVVYASGDGTAPGDGNIYAFDAQTGTLLWKRQLNNMSMTTPLVADGLVFVGSGNQSFTPSEQAADNVLTSTNVVRGTGSNAVYALNAVTGAVVWSYNTPGEDMPTFVYNQGTLYVANGNGTVYAFDAQSGQLEWSVNIGSYVSMSSPALVGNMLYVSGAHPYDLYAINVTTHQIAWAVPVPQVFGGSDDCSLAVADGTVFLEGTQGSWTKPVSTVFAFSAATGRLLWETPLGTGLLPTNIEVAAPVVVGSTVYVGSPIADEEAALNAQTGKILWTFNPGAPISESAAVVGNTLYVGDQTGSIYALNAATGDALAVRDVGGFLAADYPVIIGQTLYQPNENGEMDALPLADWNPAIGQAGPDIPLPTSGPLAPYIKKGEELFMGTSLSKTGISCNTCHTGGGTLANYVDGLNVPSLIGAAMTFPKIKNGKIMTLDAQINHCLRRAQMDGPTLAVSSPQLTELNLYLHWLSSGFSERLFQSANSKSSSGGGCK
jgi:outer membrane protein assembly factor BamB